ncbi:PAS domain-containing protein [Streptomyces sp. NRRL F-5755]|uniref:PAS domain-containing protein n=1 Tax=Streptomyces sp. NRRL F-5755 TaxID=1519475 RepID=UPI0006AF90C0|nr:PAS domain-containing protein [Streptomyces sp. NRRL F-5755]
MHEVLRATSDSQLFLVTAAPYVVLDTDLRIRAANPAYLRATGRTRDELIGAFMFDAFPDNPEDPTATGVRNLGASLERVLRYGVPDDMGVQRYDIPDPEVPGTFRPKTWSPVNSPLVDGDGRVVGALHHAEDITAVHEILGPADGEADVWDTARQPTALLRRAMLAAARYARAHDTWQASRHSSGERSAADIARRDALWHRIVHAARRSLPQGCADAVCAAAVRELPTVDAAAITLHGRGPVPHHLAASSPSALRAEELQWVAGEGPSLTAYETGEPVLVADVDRCGSRWPFCADAVSRAGVSAVFAYPLRNSATTLGTLTLYREGRSPRRLGPPLDAAAFADITTAVLLADMDTEIIQQLRTTADADDINTAIGVLAAAQGISTDDAAVWLRTTAASQRLSRADIARTVLARYGV